MPSNGDSSPSSPNRDPFSSSLFRTLSNPGAPMLERSRTSIDGILVQNGRRSSFSHHPPESEYITEESSSSEASKADLEGVNKGKRKEKRRLFNSSTFPWTSIKNKNNGMGKSSNTIAVAEESSSPTYDDDPPLSPLNLLGYKHTTRSHLLNASISNEIRNLLPARSQLYDEWTLVYSLEQHGASLNTLYQNAVPPVPGSKPGYVLVIKDTTHTLFGGFANEYFHPTESKRYYGNGDCFLWKHREIPKQSFEVASDEEEYRPNCHTESFHEERPVNARFQAFPYTGLNDFIIFCTPKFLSMGGGEGRYGIWIDSDLEKGVSGSTLTFGNEPLCGSGTKFDILGVELWRIG
ncbi:TLD-domain-containing protein [Nadsonia fulvescens var. elongata DSM 6958]|uniref:Oxidation resistance protein 1 n=1 Tax=Nadsonia fulvescens var. elongata DSM 6958 TaxID=857566 RepID=A0A1E3PQF8_9ASCO|nr:TLD-domain-containing protein [Nadsonia fulvescens var. elongata DSM 6958]